MKTIFLIMALCLHSADATGATIDRVVAYIDDTAITERELNAQHKKDISLYPSRTRRQTLEAMINTSLMIRDARKLRLWAKNDSELLQKYLDLKVRAVILVSERDIATFYKENRDRYAGRDLKDLKPEIRKYLEEFNYNTVLKELIAGLREAALIRILEE
jgi:hypothetical protein